MAWRAQAAKKKVTELNRWLTSAIPAMDEPAARAVIDSVAANRKSISMLHRHMCAHPDALTSGDSDCSAVVLRLIRTLADADYPVTPLRCVACHRSGLTLDGQVDGGRMCRTCADRRRAQPCSRCGKVTTVRARRGGKPVCALCHASDPATGSTCSRCGVLGHIARRTADGERLCRSCYQPPVRECIQCGRVTRPSRRTAAGPICQSCCRNAPRRCERCGTVTMLATRRGSSHALCTACLPSRHHTQCHLCAQWGPWRASRRHDGGKTCPSCRVKTGTASVQECALCGRERRIIVSWPVGAVCGTCYKRSRSNPGACAACGATQVLVGRDDHSGGLCGPCCGRPDTDYRCTRCGSTGFFHAAGLCPRCHASDRIHELLADPAGSIPAELVPFAQALYDADSPDGVLQWLRAGQPAAQILDQLRETRTPVSHDLLDTFPQTLALHRLRQTLVHTGVLEERADYLERLVPWLESQLNGHPTHRAHLVRTYVHWTLFRRARQRSRVRPFSPGAGNWLRTRVRATIDFLTWLDDHNVTLAEVSQPAIDRWLTARPTDATYAAREFLYWARQRKLTGKVTIPKRPHHTDLPPITEDERWEQLRRCLHEHTLPTDVRAAGALVLLFGLPVSRITTLCHDDITRDDDGLTWVRMPHHLLLIPAAVAELVHQQCTTGTGAARLSRTNIGTTRWVFPGGLPGRPARDALYRALRKHLPVHMRRARSAALAALAAEIPAAVLAQLLDLNIHTANAWATYAQHDWSAYLAARTTASRR